MNLHDADELLTPAEVAAMLFVDPKTVTRWARAGKLDAIRTPGGHRRYRRTDVLAIMTGDYQTAVPVALSSRSIPVSREPVDAGEVVAAVLVAEEAATALEAEADLAAQAMRETAVAVAAAAERAATAASRARAARAFAASL
ncbi:MAG: DNA-binding protein, partial [Marmoricola sp.]|nr:DNA-binding protein [Marmoricola sp.]